MCDLAAATRAALKLGRVGREEVDHRAVVLLFDHVVRQVAAALAMEDAGLAAGAGDPLRFGVLLGVNALSWELGAMTQYLAASESRQARTLR